MQQDKRSPDFSKIHPTAESFKAAKLWREKMSTINDSFNSILAQNEQVNQAMVQAISDASYDIPTSFSLRRFGENLLENIQTKIVPSSLGRIERILITPPWYFKDDKYRVSDLNIRHYRSLIKGLGESREYIIVCHPELRDEIQKWFDHTINVSWTLVSSPMFKPTIWAQDAYVALTTNQIQTILLEGVLFNRHEDMTIADEVSAQTDVSVMSSSLFFEGGNVLGGKEITLIGDDYIYKNETRYEFPNYDSVIQGFEKVLGTTVIGIGGDASSDYDLLDKGVFSGLGYQPIFHIDMYITMTGMIGDNDKEIVMLGRPSEAFKVCEHYAEVEEYDTPELDSFFQQSYDQLSEYFDVRLLPIMLTEGDLNGFYDERRFYWLTFNNVVIENSGSESKVIMPNYSEDAGNYGTN